MERDLLDTLASELLERETLTRKDLEPFRLLFAKLRNSAGAEGMETLVIASVEDDGASGSVSWYLAATAARYSGWVRSWVKAMSAGRWALRL